MHLKIVACVVFIIRPLPQNPHNTPTQPNKQAPIIALQTLKSRPPPLTVDCVVTCIFLLPHFGQNKPPGPLTTVEITEEAIGDGVGAFDSGLIEDASKLILLASAPHFGQNFAPGIMGSLHELQFMN